MWLFILLPTVPDRSSQGLNAGWWCVCCLWDSPVLLCSGIFTDFWVWGCRAMVSNSLTVAPCKYSPIFAVNRTVFALFSMLQYQPSDNLNQLASSCVSCKPEQVKSPADDGWCAKLYLGVTGLDPRSKAESGASCLAGGGGCGHDPAQDSG